MDNGGVRRGRVPPPSLISTLALFWRKRMTESMNESMSDGGICKTAPATPGLLMTYRVSKCQGHDVV